MIPELPKHWTRLPVAAHGSWKYRWCIYDANQVEIMGPMVDEDAEFIAELVNAVYMPANLNNRLEAV